MVLLALVDRVDQFTEISIIDSAYCDKLTLISLLGSLHV